MTKEEYQKWGRDFKNRFPGIGHWLANPLRRQLRVTFFKEIFADLDLDVCLAISRGMTAGRIPKYPDDWCMLGAHYREQAKPMMRIKAMRKRHPRLHIPKMEGEPNNLKTFKALRACKSAEERQAVMKAAGF